MEQITLKKRDWSDSVVGKNVRLLKRGGRPSLICDMLTTSSGFTRVTNGKPLSALPMDLLNGVSCLLNLPMPLLLFSAS